MRCGRRAAGWRARHRILRSASTCCAPGYEIFRYCDSELGEVSLHHHDFYEIYLFLNGSVEYSIESRIYRLLPGRHPAHRPHGSCTSPAPRRTTAPMSGWCSGLDKRYLEQLSTPQTSLTRCFDASAPGHTNLLRLPPAQRRRARR